LHASTDGKLIIGGTNNMRLPEVNQADRSLPYSMAIPNIIISRINPGHFNAVLNG